ncbi:TPM domain-containing protein [Fusobacterium ulcerans]|uniref:TPM domain-containing protein n=1 Tax=Fusobacterium ulcerans TaxID=861 RepID=UPI0026ECFA6E|nr:TPM domain-containing protein [Fusobacterium ulcerans]
MKKTFFIIGLLAVFNVSFAKLNDNLKIFSQDEKIKVESKITELEDKRKLHIYVNTLPTDEGFSVEDPEKIIILNRKKDDSGKGKIELSFSKDINVEECQDGINLVLENAENTLSKGEAGNYAIEVLDGIDGVLDKVNVEEPIVIEEEIVDSEKNTFFIGMGIAFFIIFAIILRVLFVKKKRENQKEKSE